MQIAVRQLSKRFGSFQAVDGVSFEIGEGKLVGLLGPSGGGKTTILRMLAGLEEPDSGELFFGDRKVNRLSPQEREIGFVFQHYALFQHMTVYENIAFGLQTKMKQLPDAIRRNGKAYIDQRVNELLALIGLSDLAARFPHQLSGGQKQRVAFARALAPEPKLLLLDEPFAAMDAKVRRELRGWLREMIDRLGITTIFVTHDQEEAVEVADEMLILQQGRLEQQGSPVDMYTKPRTPFVAGFIGESIRVEGLSRWKGFEETPPDAEAFVRPEWIEIGTAKEVPLKSAARLGVVENCLFRGSQWLIEAKVDDTKLFAYRPVELGPLQPNTAVFVLLHRAYAFRGQESFPLENTLKNDPQPVHI
ncbi:sulfate/molybdate ABC transporter ATP-binding protein [Paenibacillus contaminans]|uniref:Carnitine transport ATP-binding protein OpuCA n=1 Tax=Paenibacillus contaminans TaxID=450362 RepID=A0A329M6B4_9BACL|nr:ATP-binding cassette domain-containing protein [Paenibacillus contaminans]RAV15360.1 molybdenum ABC transporter ATP-binding protein [Paenibacillus contaminans]